MTSRIWQLASNSVKTSLTILAIISLSSCSTITYTPEESAARIQELEQKNKTLEKLWQGAETDLSACMNHLKRCQPLISNPSNN
jgi:hypothetical protein